MRWIFTLALFVLSGYLFANGNIILAALVGFIAVINLIRCIVRKVFKIVWAIIRKPLAIILAITMIAMLITAIPLFWGVKAENDVSCDYLIVLGAGVEGEEPSPILQYRIEEAYRYLSANPNTICIVSGGKGDDENISEAQCMFNHLTAMGIAADRIWMEDQATSTVENFEYSLQLLKAKTGSQSGKLGVLSSEFHLFRAKQIAKANGVSPIFVKAPTTNKIVLLNYTIREIFVLWKYLIIGG